MNIDNDQAEKLANTKEATTVFLKASKVDSIRQWEIINSLICFKLSDYKSLILNYKPRAHYIKSPLCL
jgi:hypothetical protein